MKPTVKIALLPFLIAAACICQTPPPDLVSWSCESSIDGVSGSSCHPGASGESYNIVLRVDGLCTNNAPIYARTTVAVSGCTFQASSSGSGVGFYGGGIIAGYVDSRVDTYTQYGHYVDEAVTDCLGNIESTGIGGGAC